MGCCLSDKSELVSKSEAAMVREEDLGFDRLNLEGLVEGLKAGTRDFVISWIRLQELYARFNLPIDQIRKPETAIGNFYDSFLKDEDSYDTLKLIMLAVLLCQGNTPIKAEIVFSHFDINDNQTLSKQELSDILNIMLELTCIQLPQYILNRSQEAKSPDIDTIKKYQQRLEETKQEAFDLLLGEMKTEQLSQAEFLSALQNTSLRAICSARSLRQFTAAPHYYRAGEKGSSS